MRDLPNKASPKMTVDLYCTFAEPLSDEMLFRWHAMVMSGRRDLKDVGRYRTGAASSLRDDVRTKGAFRGAAGVASAIGNGTVSLPGFNERHRMAKEFCRLDDSG